MKYVTIINNLKNCEKNSISLLIFLEIWKNFDFIKGEKKKIKVSYCPLKDTT